MLTPGEVIANKYRIERHLAEGGMGAVYIAENVDTEKKVALKVLFPHVLQSADAVKKFQMEARVAARVGSAHIVDVLDSGFDEVRKTPFLAMELLSGETLEAHVARKGALPPYDVVTFLRQVASALDKAHSYRDRQGTPQPIVHRDLKPENLFLTRRENGEYLVKVLDFGIAKVLSEGTGVTQEIKGTPLYMAFEQASGQAVSPGTDIWALGLIAYFLLTGEPYWRAAVNPEATAVALFGEILTLPIDPPSSRLRERGRPALPQALDGWFQKCVHRDPKARFRSAGVCIEDLAEIFGFGDATLAADTRAVAQLMAGRASGPQIDLAMGATVASPNVAQAVSSPGVGAATAGAPSSFGVFRRDDFPVPAGRESPIGSTAGGVASTQGVSPPTQPSRLPIVLSVGGLAIGAVGILAFLVSTRSAPPKADVAAASGPPSASGAVPTSQPPVTTAASVAPPTVTAVVALSASTSPVVSRPMPNAAVAPKQKPTTPDDFKRDR